MGLTDLLSDFYSAMTFTEAHAEAPPANGDESDGKADESSEDGGEEKSEDAGDEKEDGGDDEGEGESDEGGDDGEDEEEEEEEEEEEPEDPKPRLEEECAKSAQCAPMKHHYDECVERFTEQSENPDHKGPKENCVEEFFHLSHCATQCAAPKLFRVLK